MADMVAVTEAKLKASRENAKKGGVKALRRSQVNSLPSHSQIFVLLKIWNVALK